MSSTVRFFVYSLCCIFFLISAGKIAVYSNNQLSEAWKSFPSAELSPRASISIISMWPGKAVHIAFGHTAFRVQDPARNWDIVFNYGSFDFDDPLFIPRFIYGDLQYRLSVSSYEAQVQYDRRYEDRIWREQIIDLSQDDKNKLFRFLVWNSQAENAGYRYDFIIDNCATRIPLALRTVFADRLDLASSALRADKASGRILINRLVADRPHWAFLFDLALGTKVDRALTVDESMFLPLELIEILDSALIDGRKLIKSNMQISGPIVNPSHSTPWSDPGFLLWPIALLSLIDAIRHALRKKSMVTNPRLVSRLVHVSFLFGLGLIGILIWSLSFFSLHFATKANIMTIVLHPMYLILIPFVLTHKRPKWIEYAYRFLTFLCVVPIILFFLWPQPLHHAIWAIGLLIFTRLFVRCNLYLSKG